MERFAKILLTIAWVLSIASVPRWFMTIFGDLVGDDIRSYPVNRWYYPDLFVSFAIWGPICLIASTVLVATGYLRTSALVAAVPLIFVLLAHEHLL